MITYAESLSDESGADSFGDDAGRQERELTYQSILRTLQICDLGQDDDNRRLTRSVILGEN